MDVQEKITMLKKEQKAIEEKYNGKPALFMGVTRTVYADPDRDAACARHKEIDSEIKALATEGIADLKAEQVALEKKLPKFGKKLFYTIAGTPKEVSVAEKRYEEICSEISDLESVLRRFSC